MLPPVLLALLYFLACWYTLRGLYRCFRFFFPSAEQRQADEVAHARWLEARQMVQTSHRDLARNMAYNERCVRQVASVTSGLRWAMAPLREPCIPPWQPRPPAPPHAPPDPDDELFTASGLLLPPAPGPRPPFQSPARRRLTD
jgi:hypothetical protein